MLADFRTGYCPIDRGYEAPTILTPLSKKTWKSNYLLTVAAPGLRIWGAFEGQTHILGGQDRIFKKVLLFAHAVVTGLLSPSGDSPPSQKGAIFLGIPPPGDEYPRNIAPPHRGANAPGISPPPFRIFAPHICNVVYSNNFVILSSY
jgi:hypothetical protein